MCWLWPHFKRIWAAAGAIAVGLAVNYLYALVGKLVASRRAARADAESLARGRDPVDLLPMDDMPRAELCHLLVGKA